MSELVRKSHNATVLIYHYVCPAKYRRTIFDPKVDEVLKETCEEIEKRYEIRFLEIGTDKNHVHFLIQSIPMYSHKKIIQVVKGLTARGIFKKVPEVREKLWGGEIWSDGYYVSTVGQKGSEETIRKYVRDQGKEENYQQLYGQQLSLFD